MARQRSDHLVRLPPVQSFPVASKELPRADEAPAGKPPRDPDVGRNSSDNGIGVARGALPAAERPSLGRRIFRSVAGFFIMALTAVLTSIVVSSALQSHGDGAKEVVMTWGSSLGGSSSTWQSRGDEAKRMVKEAWASSLDWLMKNSPLGVDTAAKQKGSTSTGQVSTREAVLSASVAKKPAPVTAVLVGAAAQDHGARPQCRATEARAAYCCATTDGAKNRVAASAPAEHQAEGVIPTFVPSGARPVAQK